jgi:hypothetical protein
LTVAPLNKCLYEEFLVYVYNREKQNKKEWFKNGTIEMAEYVEK